MQFPQELQAQAGAGVMCSEVCDKGVYPTRGIINKLKGIQYIEAFYHVLYDVQDVDKDRVERESVRKREREDVVWTLQSMVTV